MDIYRDNKLRYPLDDNEHKLLDQAWQLLDLYKNGIVCMHKYRKNIIKTIKYKYTAEKFLKLENILDKLFWNLRHKLNIFNKSNIVEYKLNELNLVKDKLKLDTYYRSFINKIINIDDVNEKIYYKKMEGSAAIFDKNAFNLLTSSIFMDKNIYTNIMHNTENISNIKLLEHYYQLDYAFPNLNLCHPLIGSQKFRLKKINKMYFDKNAENNWFTLIT
jgi:hypothetical protein